jgi:PD-(D/E)XK nuclease superfamily
MFTTSQTRVNTWRLCRRKFWYSFVLRIKRRVKARPLKFGGIVHKMLEEQAAGGDMFKTLDTIAEQQQHLFIEERETYGNMVQDIRYIMRAYVGYWPDKLKMVKVNGRLVEHDFKFPITPDLVVQGRIDGFAHSKKMNWLLEHKTHGTFPNADHRWRNLQSSVYIPIAEGLGWCKKIEGTLWNYVRSKPPTRPQLKKNGQLSERQIDTLPEVIRDVVSEHKLSIKHYQGLLAQQTDNLSTWFERVYTPRNQTTVKLLWEDFITTSQEMMDLHHKRKERNIGKHCDWCEFEPLCRAKLTASDYDFVMEREFIEKPEGDYDEESTDSTSQ